MLRVALILLTGVGLTAMSIQEESIFRGSRANIEKLQIEPVHIVDEKRSGLDVSDPANYPGCSGNFSNAALNSRQPVLKTDTNKLTQVTKLSVSELNPDLVIAQGENVYLRGQLNWV